MVPNDTYISCASCELHLYQPLQSYLREPKFQYHRIALLIYSVRCCALWLCPVTYGDEAITGFPLRLDCAGHCKLCDGPVLYIFLSYKTVNCNLLAFGLPLLILIKNFFYLLFCLITDLIQSVLRVGQCFFLFLRGHST